jgi:hypothetical protein
VNRDHILQGALIQIIPLTWGLVPCARDGQAAGLTIWLVLRRVRGEARHARPECLRLKNWRLELVSSKPEQLRPVLGLRTD